MKKVLLLLLKGVEIYEFSTFFDVLGWSNHYGERVDVTASGFAHEVQSTFGLMIKPDCLIDEINIDDFDALAIPGGFEEFGFYEEAFSDKVSEIIRHFNGTSKVIASICVGALPIGKSGALNNRCATTYNLTGPKRVHQLAEFGADVKKSPVVEDKNIITSSSPGTAVHVAFLLLEKLTSKENADIIRKEMGFK